MFDKDNAGRVASGEMRHVLTSLGKMYGLLTKCEVKMAGDWPSSFFCVFMDRDGVEVHKLAKKNKANIQPS